MITTTSDRPVVNLVRFKKEYFPLAKADLQVLFDRKVSVTRISESTLSVLKETLLKKVKIVVWPWVDIFPMLLEAFKGSFSKKYKFLSDENWVIISSERNEKTEEDRVKADKARAAEIEARVILLNKYCGRYGFKVLAVSKVKKHFYMERLTFVPDKNRVPSLNFNLYDVEETPIELKFRLSSACQVVMTKKKSPSGIPSLKVTFEDRFGSEFAESFSRAFNFSEVKPEDCEAAINFFVTLLMLSSNKK